MRNDDETIARARRLWDQGLSVTAIGRHLGVTRNVIVGIAHRNGFAQKPSPIGNGEANGRAILTAYNVGLIRSGLASGVTQAELAARFGVSRSTIHSISSGRTWRTLKRTAA